MRKQFIILISLWALTNHACTEISIRMVRQQEETVFVIENALGFEIVKIPKDNTILLRFKDAEGQYDIACSEHISKLSSFIVENYAKFKASLSSNHDNIQSLMQNLIRLPKNTCVPENYRL